MNIRKKIIIFACLIFPVTNTWGQVHHLSFHRIGNKEGFNQNTISSILQDHQGFLWFGTPNSLIRNDGINVYNHPGHAGGYQGYCKIQDLFRRETIK